MYEYKTPEAILEAMLEDVDDSIDKREGSVAYDLLYPSAIELSLAYVELDAVMMLAFAETTEGQWLDLRAGEFGVTRKAAAKSEGIVTLTGPEGTIVPVDTLLMTDDEEPVYFLTKDEVVLTGGMATVTAESQDGGEDGNILAGRITSLAPGDLSGVVMATNALAFSGGADAESDKELLGRLKDRVQKPATSGNANHYLQWAREVVGVSDAKVYPLWAGPGTVKVVLLSSDRKAPNQTIINAATTYIESQRPFGAAVTVTGVVEVPINVTATLTLQAGGDILAVKAEFETALDEYLEGLAFRDTIVRYSRIANLLLDIPDVLDYSGLTINGGTANIAIPDGQVAINGTVTLT
ncbi:baseplate J/gp47 family protein [Mesobacillus zeae]|uniref:Baseplate J/gp47 family protein n=1 Tax=Mesobacillus zeae TaxID=1917180 RepID=A0A398BH57_9BACI|nr:baseplate J/gp47 family protein [Mesobacillus zeae]RID88934.1 baseplate J/gp47 family protein [Mesobacillus zeae]